jgi:hypothetical protein
MALIIPFNLIELHPVLMQTLRAAGLSLLIRHQRT